MADQPKNDAKAETDPNTGLKLQSAAELESAKKAETDTTPKPIKSGQYKVAGHTNVRSLDKTFCPGDDFTGDAGDVAGLVKLGALVEV